MNTTELRIVPPEEARALADAVRRGYTHDAHVASFDLAHTAAVLGEQREAVLALLATADKYQDPGVPAAALRRALGVH